ALLKTFADQAVIAIENVRLFKELEVRNRDLTTALEQQTATSEILRVISGSPTDVQPVFDTIVETAARLCNALYSTLATFDGELLHLVAAHNWTPTAFDVARRLLSDGHPSRATGSGRAILERSVVQVPDAELDPEYELQELTRVVGSRSGLFVPMLRDGAPVGVIAVGRAVPGTFSDNEIALLKTFADQAVIAIENVRLFKELEARNSELSEALEQQTATSEILRVISSSPTDVQPVFDAIVRSASRLCGGEYAIVTRYDGQLLHLAAQYNPRPGTADTTPKFVPQAPHRGGIPPRAFLDARMVHVSDVDAEELEPSTREFYDRIGLRAVLAVPMIHEGRPIGVVSVSRGSRGRFSDRQIKLLQTFADQAVIAIENVRLFKELETRTQDLTRSVGELRALGEVGQAISATLDLQTVLRTIVARATQLAGVDAGVIYEYDEQAEIFMPRATERLEAQIVETLIAAPVRKGEGVTGRLAEAQEPIQLLDILEAPAESRVRDILGPAGYRALLAVPLVRDDHLLGGLTVFRKTPGEFAPAVIDLLRTFA